MPRITRRSSLILLAALTGAVAGCSSPKPAYEKEDFTQNDTYSRSVAASSAAAWASSSRSEATSSSRSWLSSTTSAMRASGRSVLLTTRITGRCAARALRRATRPIQVRDETVAS